jgi:hypothetical protein
MTAVLPGQELLKMLLKRTLDISAASVESIRRIPFIL